MRAARPSIPDTRYGERLGRAQGLLLGRGIAALLIGVGADLRYLTGYEAMPLERLTMLVLPVHGSPTLVAPRLEAMAAERSPAARLGGVRVAPWDETDDAHALVASLLADALGHQMGRGDRILVSDRLWAMHVFGLQRTLAGASFGLASSVLRDLRMTKDAEEIALMRLAAHAADRVVAQIAGGPSGGQNRSGRQPGGS